jgi:hypothetical protein
VSNGAGLFIDEFYAERDKVNSTEIVELDFEFWCGVQNGTFYIRRYDDEVAVWEIEHAYTLINKLVEFIKLKGGTK